MFERLECWASEQPIRQFRGRLANAAARLLVESGKRNVASESGVEYAVQVILPTIALLIEEFIPSTSLSVDADLAQLRLSHAGVYARIEAHAGAPALPVGGQ
ncbi:hypothetical protein ACFQJ5_19800 [Halomicroarcula sp. GCM10025324]|uniref:hypothetical protein n=1 Tax=Halomicroarcula sp. GCM10025324 TaxID=3252667 RepID=UPI00362348E1